MTYITPASRYANNPTIQIPGRDGTTRSVIITAEWLPRQYSFTFYQWTDDDTLDKLATTFYGNPLRWWLIARANPEIIDWDTVNTGDTIRVPSG